MLISQQTAQRILPEQPVEFIGYQCPCCGEKPEHEYVSGQEGAKLCPDCGANLQLEIDVTPVTVD